MRVDSTWKAIEKWYMFTTCSSHSASRYLPNLDGNLYILDIGQGSKEFYLSYSQAGKNFFTEQANEKTHNGLTEYYATCQSKQSED